MGQKIQFSSESILFKKNQKFKKKKCIVTVKDSYRPVIKGFVQYQHSSVELVLKTVDRKLPFSACFFQILSIFVDILFKLSVKVKSV